MTDMARIRLASGWEATVSAAYAESSGAEVIDAPATNRRGVPLTATRRNGRRAKPRTTVSNEAAKKATTTRRTTDAEEAS